MADVDTHFPQPAAQIGVTTGPIRGSRKIHVAVPTSPDVRVAMREIGRASCRERVLYTV